MEAKRHLAFLPVLALACNAVLGLEEKKPELGSDSSGSGAGAGTSGGGSGVGGSSSGGKGGSGPMTGGSSGDAGGGGSPDGECTPGDERECRAIDPTLLGNCARGMVRCDADGAWESCSVQPQPQDSCDDEGDDANCDGTPNGDCPCLSVDTRQCGEDAGVCEFGIQRCTNERWGDCEGGIGPMERDCQSSDDNDCDGQPDDIVDETCPCASDGQHTCLETAPTDWSGPIALATVPASAPAPSCNSTYERDVLSLFGSLDEGPEICGCACGTPSGMSCAQPVAIHFIQGTVTPVQCGLPMSVDDEPEYEVNYNQCPIVSGTGTYKPIRPRFSASGSCTANPTVDVGPAGWTRRMTACETTEQNGAGCANEELCMPNLTGSFEAWCIHRDGEHACPTGSYSEQSVYYEAFDDQRSCAACSCAAPTGTCQGHVDFTTGAPNPNGCGGLTSRGRIEFGECRMITAPAAAHPTATPEGACSPMGGTLQGEVVREGAVTVCCKP